MIELNGVTKRYLRREALKDVSLTLEHGQIIGLVGENGSGKSTMLKLIAGLVQPTSGTVNIDGSRVDRRSSRIVSYLSELDTYFPFYNIGETMAFFATQFADFDRGKAEEIATFMELDLEQKVKQLSKGNRGRLKIVLSLSRTAPVLLMDEPLSGLDPMVRHSIVKGLLSFIDVKQQTVVIATHEVSEVEPILDQVVALHNGRVLEKANVETLREQEKRSIVDWMHKSYKA